MTLLRAWLLRLRLLPAGWTIALLAAAGMVFSAYPVVFLGKSYVSPHYGSPLLYESPPMLPQARPARTTTVQGSDVGALMWQHVPYSMFQHRALAGGELPVWNRYSASGIPLLGQGQTMFGDPLHFLVIAARGAAWAWDLKFLLAKFLLGLGLGLTVLVATGHHGAAGWVAFAAPCIGFFVFRVNHPAVFSLCYAPWPLYCWLRLARSTRRRAWAGWLGALLLANFALLHSGTIKEAYVLLMALNLTGALVLLLDWAPWRTRLAKLALAAWAGVLFVVLTLPTWWTFLSVLQDARTSYDLPGARQLSLSLLLASFDEALFRPLTPGTVVLDPSANFLVLGGCLYLVAGWRRFRADRTFLALVAATLPAMAIVYGLVPARWISAVPFLGQIIHVDNTFSCVLIILWSVLAGYGFAAAAARLRKPVGRRDLQIAGAALAVLLGAYVVGLLTYVSPETKPVAGRLGSEPFVWGYLGVLVAALFGLSLAIRRVLTDRRPTRGRAAGIAFCTLVLLWRPGLHAEVGFSHFTVRPGPRADLHAPSPALEQLRPELAREPGRVVGLRRTLMPGWSGVYGIETISAPDALMNVAYRELMEASPLRREWDWRYHLEAADAARCQRFLDFLNVRFCVLDAGKAPAGLPGWVVRGTQDLGVYESPSSWPRAFFTDRARRYEHATDLVREIETGDGRPFAAVQRTTAQSLPATLRLDDTVGPRRIVPATRYRLTEATTTFHIAAPTAGLVVLTEARWPRHGQVRVDGQTTALLQVNHAFQGVLVNAGGHEISVSYQPEGLASSLRLSAGALLLLIISGAALFAWPSRRLVGGKPAIQAGPDRAGCKV
ncbi:hypothetical protein [Opitutus sp. ER46]|uniref:hypothetical protein n=1 Tax=Opitutus sp. ER46 TaxID=2161864 RepID=UPI000D2F8A86|nr:hypothetical protein [Opitutus sp. ER46]PTX92696.1 hypothetical protein DB354_15355 [Opitutus sp. ER46]